jgi:hypothetical protein
MKRALALVAVVVVALALPACATVRSTVDVYRAMRSAGYDNISVRFNTNDGFDTVVVRASGGPSEDPQGAAAKIVWEKFRFKFDQLDVGISGDQRQVFSRKDLETRFGPRPPGMDRDLATDIFRTIAIVAAIGVVLVGIVALVVILAVRSSRRRRPPMPPPPPGWYPPPPQWPPPQSQ